MGMQSGGIIIPFKGTEDEALQIVSTWLNQPLHILEQGHHNFDVRQDHDVYLNILESCLIIHHANFAASIISQQDIWEKRFKQTNLNDWVIVFACYDSANYYGYSLFEQTKLKRYFYQNHEGEIEQFGEPSSIEKAWLNAAYFYEYEYLTEDGDYETITIENNNKDFNQIDAWNEGNYEKYLYVENRDKYVSENELAAFFLSQLTYQYIHIDIRNFYTSTNIYLTTSTGLEIRNQQLLQETYKSEAKGFMAQLIRLLGFTHKN